MIMRSLSVKQFTVLLLTTSKENIKREDKIDFNKYITEHITDILGEDSIQKGYLKKFQKNFVALDMKMNELIADKPEVMQDPVFLLGIFDWSINQLFTVNQVGLTLSTDVSRYKASFIQLIEENR